MNAKQKKGFSIADLAALPQVQEFLEQKRREEFEADRAARAEAIDDAERSMEAEDMARQALAKALAEVATALDALKMKQARIPLLEEAFREAKRKRNAADARLSRECGERFISRAAFFLQIEIDRQARLCNEFRSNTHQLTPYGFLREIPGQRDRLEDAERRMEKLKSALVDINALAKRRCASTELEHEVTQRLALVGLSFPRAPEVLPQDSVEG